MSRVFGNRPTDPRVADIGPRFLARFLDTVTAEILFVGVCAAMNVTVYGKDNVLTGRAIAAQLVIAFFYEVPSTAIWGQTLGKRLARIQVVRIESNAAPGIGRALLRFLTVYVAGVLPIVGIPLSLIVQLWFLWDPRRQNIPDKVARTLVVKVGAGDPGVIDIG